MTKEQGEALDYIQKQIDYYKEQIKFIEAVDSDYYDEEYELYKNRTKQFSTVLSLIKEQQEEIENLKNKEVLIKRYFQKCDLIKQKDKIIDLMSKQLAGLTIFDIEKDEPLILTDKEEVISYFANKVNSKIQ